MKHTVLIAMIAAFVIALPAAAQHPYKQAEDTWITLNGMVVSTDTNNFQLDYGPRKITVIMGDWLKRYGGTTKMLEGHNVTVSGRITNSWFTDKKIQAQSIYVNDFNTSFSMHELGENSPSGVVLALSDVRNRVFVTGVVSSVDGRKFTIKIGGNNLTVNTDTMNYNPMDSSGYQQIKVGDRVQVSGDVDKNFLNYDELTAQRIVTLSQPATSKTSRTSGKPLPQG